MDIDNNYRINKWSNNPEVVKKIFSNASKLKCIDINKGIFLNLLCVSHLYNYIGSKTKDENNCRCDCVKMKQFKISESIKKWMCEGCEDRIHDSSWTLNDYYRKKVFKTICKECYERHWIGVSYKPISLCLKDV